MYSARAKYTRIASSKMLLPLELVKQKKASDALALLAFVPNKGARILEKLIRSAVANAQYKDKQVDSENLYIREFRLGPGPMVRFAKRWRPSAMGRASRIRRRTSHITIILDTTTKSKEKA
ncbi:MAG: 50S ribosomal protein L22 [bacterium]|nr:50S ribosomal protein L22 [bacterium]